MFWRSLKSFIRSWVASVDGQSTQLSHHSEANSRSFVKKPVEKSENWNFPFYWSRREKQSRERERERSESLFEENSWRTCDCVGGNSERERGFSYKKSVSNRKIRANSVDEGGKSKQKQFRVTKKWKSSSQLSNSRTMEIKSCCIDCRTKLLSNQLAVVFI